MADKLAVIDDLSEVRGDDAIDTNGSHITTGKVFDVASVNASTVMLHSQSTGSLVNITTDGTNSFLLYANQDTAGVFRVFGRDHAGVTFVNYAIGNTLTQGVAVPLSLSLNGTSLIVNLEGVEILNTTIPTNTTNGELLSCDFGQNSDAVILTAELNEFSFINNGDFGNSTLESVPVGAEGQLNSTTWNKVVNGQPVSIVAPDQAALLAQLPATPAETWEVIDTTVGSTVPPTNDASWLLYDDQYLIVTVQISAISILLLQMEMEKMKILRTIQADTIGAGVATFNQDITSLMSTGSGILSVKIGSDTVFRELTISSDGRFYPVGNIRAIDTDSPTTVDLSLVTLGFPSIYSEVVISNDA